MIFVHGIGHFHPDNIIDNAFLEQLDIATTDEWILERVGIRERRTLLSLDYIRTTKNQQPELARQHSVATSIQTGVTAAQLALEQAQLSPAAIGMVIAGSCAPHYALPGDASAIAGNLGIKALALDINAACVTFAAQIHLVQQMQATALPDYILLVIPDNATRIIDYRDRTTAVLWGDASVALIISKTVISPMRITHTVLDSNPTAWDKITAVNGQHFFQEGRAIQKFAIAKTVAVLDRLRQIAKLAPDAHYFIGHQANLLMLESICRRAKVASKNHFYNVDQFGNCGAAGAPSVLSQRRADFRAGDKLILAAVGAGLSWGGMVIEFN